MIMIMIMIIVSYHCLRKTVVVPVGHVLDNLIIPDVNVRCLQD